METAPARKPYPSDVSDEEWAFVAPYLVLMRPDAPQGQRTTSSAVARSTHRLSPTSIFPSLLPNANTTGSHCYAVLMEHPTDRAIRIANLFRNLPDREPVSVEPHRFLGIFRCNPLFPQYHTLTLEELPKPTPRDTALRAQCPKCRSSFVSSYKIFDFLRRKPSPEAPRRDLSGFDQ